MRGSWVRACALTAFVVSGCTFAAEGSEGGAFGPPTNGAGAGDGKQDEPDGDDHDGDGDGEPSDDDDDDGGGAEGPILMEVCSDQVLEIPEPPGVLTAELFPDVSGMVLDVVVHVEIDHPRTGDLDATLVHGDFADMQLFDVPEGCEIPDITATFDDEGEEVVGCAPGNEGVRRPIERLSDLAGPMDEEGWFLRVRDGRAGNSGRLVQWCLELTMAP